ncbi:amidohydrolase family protein [Rhodococcus sp. CX]|uniref:N-acyl-D-amino-acid deacylase family protein n=1 Tax=Rhodococcus sp. CX TaxID=2789880 RepID=UPI0018CE2F5D|nr:amidohydrolase family protein [Rhodococcus sp. CX]MBH0119436.1 amidohydrolase family protein [Rhodococcus sp. CX]
MFDLLIKNGTIADGSGEPAVVRDVAIADGRIVAVEPKIAGDAREVIDATGKLVTPGFIDVHTHYDGQLTWDSELLPSSGHGVTTVVTGNCGIGFAPVRKGSEDWLVALTEGVEDIPGSALHDGITWGWETFPQYLDVLADREFAVDVATQVPHSAVRAYVLGSRAETDESATDEEIAEIARIVGEGIGAGAVGVGTSRVAAHRGSGGEILPGTRAAEEELLAMACAMRDAGGGVFQLVPSGVAGGVEGQPGEQYRAGLGRRDANTLSSEIEMMRRLHRATGQSITFTFAENLTLGAEEFAKARALVAEAGRSGERIYPQVAPRAIGGLISLATYHPFMGRPGYVEIADLPLPERARRMSEPSVKARILAEEDLPVDSGDPRKHTHLTLQRNLANIYSLQDLDYEPDPSTSMAERGRLEGRDPLEVLYDQLIADEGRAILIWFATGFLHGNLNRIGEFLADPQYVMGLGDGGAHVAFICDASFPTFLLSHWGLRRRGPRFAIEGLVRKLTKDLADLYGFDDRGTLAVGKRADLNVIDLARLSLTAPRLVADLPSGAERFIQEARGYVATVVAGVVTRRDDRDTGARPGRLYRRRSATVPDSVVVQSTPVR